MIIKWWNVNKKKKKNHLIWNNFRMKIVICKYHFRFKFLKIKKTCKYFFFRYYLKKITYICPNIISIIRRIIIQERIMIIYQEKMNNQRLDFSRHTVDRMDRIWKYIEYIPKFYYYYILYIVLLYIIYNNLYINV